VHCLAESSNSLISFGASTGQDGSAISFVTDGVETIKFEVINAKSGYDGVRVFLGWDPLDRYGTRAYINIDCAEIWNYVSVILFYVSQAL
jgi:hypothetical protein